MNAGQFNFTRSPAMKEPKRERARALVSDLVGLAILAVLMATVVEALSPENLMRRDSGVMASAAGLSRAA
jgi:hypothetical protein